MRIRRFGYTNSGAMSNAECRYRSMVMHDGGHGIRRSRTMCLQKTEVGRLGRVRK